MLKPASGLEYCNGLAENAGDAEAWVACFTEDGVQMSPHFGTNVGKTAIRG
jgi:hypothetical protein